MRKAVSSWLAWLVGSLAPLAIAGGLGILECSFWKTNRQKLSDPLLTLDALNAHRVGKINPFSRLLEPRDRASPPLHFREMLQRAPAIIRILVAEHDLAVQRVRTLELSGFLVGTSSKVEKSRKLARLRPFARRLLEAASRLVETATTVGVPVHAPPRVDRMLSPRELLNDLVEASERFVDLVVRFVVVCEPHQRRRRPLAVGKARLELRDTRELCLLASKPPRDLCSIVERLGRELVARDTLEVCDRRRRY